ncbi:beta-galactosidase [Deinococcus koreensis]|uniref:Beta-galactosidase n=1 Tax=Deinococcus koreensis TaxID=2054903 RepID=A0A2K3V047_9DEIO|nr:beta-galactosidase [Deinococcus koreensis]PNY82153.1 beta-galactosidase [Deinococcus koreensis]
MTTAPTPPHLLLGSCDYPEHVPRDRWATYARMQKELGLSFVRIAEFAWSRIEPQCGRYDWAWLDQAIEAYHGCGLRVVLCTLTATPPAWLIRAHPEILASDEQGRVREFGSRRHYDFASPVYREHSRRLTLAMALRYGRHPAVVGWQTDNEFGCHGTTRSYGGASAAAFPEWLRHRYGVVERLNEAWGNVFWSMEYTDFSQVRPPMLTVTELNPSHVLDYARFASQQVADFQKEQLEILREMSPGRFITHNFMIFESGFDHYQVAQGLDFATWDNYPLGMLEFFAPSGSGEEVKTRYARTGHPDLIAFNHDLYRGLVAQPGLGREGRGTPNGPWVMEQQCGQVNWAPYNPLPAGGAVQLWTAQAWAHGADVVSYFRWRAATMAQEVMHSGLLRHDETPDRGYAEVETLDQTQFPVGPVPARVALLHDYESLWLYDQQKHSASLSYWTQTVAYYSALRSLGIDVDIVHADAGLSAYAVVVAPAITLVPPERAARWAKAVEGGVALVCGPRTAFRTPGGQTWETGQPGPLSDTLGVKLLQYDSLRPTLSQRVSGPGGDVQAHGWAESYRLQGAEALYSYSGGPLDGEAAVTRRGQVTTIGAHSPELIGAVLADVLQRAGVETTPLPEGVRLSRRAGRTLVQNWTLDAVQWNGLSLGPVSFMVQEE